MADGMRLAGEGPSAGQCQGEAFVTCGESYRRSKASVFAIVSQHPDEAKTLYLQRLNCVPATAA